MFIIYRFIKSQAMCIAIIHVISDVKNDSLFEIFNINKNYTIFFLTFVILTLVR